MSADGSAPRTVGILNPGEMGATVGGELRRLGHRVLWVSTGRSRESTERARAAGLEDLAGLAELVGSAEVILSICPPSAAMATAESVAGLGFSGIYVDCNAVAPRTAATISATVAAAGARAVDGGIVGTPSSAESSPRLYLSGRDAAAVAALFEGSRIDPRVLDGSPTDASALKMLYAAWTKGSAALLLAIEEAAGVAGLSDALHGEWEQSQPDLLRRLEWARRSGDAKGWRWVGEMEEIALSIADLGGPPGFHEAAATVFAAAPKPSR